MCKNTLLKIAAPILLLIVLSPMIISTHQTKASSLSGCTCVYVGCSLYRAWFKWQFFFNVPCDILNNVYYTYGAVSCIPTVSAHTGCASGWIVDNDQGLIGSLHVVITIWIIAWPIVYPYRICGTIFNCVFYVCTVNGHPIMCFRYGWDTPNNIQYIELPTSIQVTV